MGSQLQESPLPGRLQMGGALNFVQFRRRRKLLASDPSGDTAVACASVPQRTLTESLAWLDEVP